MEKYKYYKYKTKYLNLIGSSTAYRPRNDDDLGNFSNEELYQGSYQVGVRDDENDYDNWDDVPDIYPDIVPDIVNDENADDENADDEETPLTHVSNNGEYILIRELDTCIGVLIYIVNNDNIIKHIFGIHYVNENQPNLTFDDLKTNLDRIFNNDSSNYTIKVLLYTSDRQGSDREDWMRNYRDCRTAIMQVLENYPNRPFNFYGPISIPWTNILLSVNDYMFEILSAIRSQKVDRIFKNPKPFTIINRARSIPSDRFRMREYWQKHSQQ